MVSRKESALARCAELGLEDADIQLTRILELDLPFKPFTFKGGVLTPRTPVFERLARRNPKRAPICARLHRRMRAQLTRIGLGRIAQTLRDVEDELQGDPSRWDLWALSGRLKQFSNRVLEAAEDYQDALSRNPGWTQGWVWLGEAWMQTGDVRRGLAELEKASRLRRDDPWVFAWLWAGYSWLERRARARESLRRALSLAPESPELLALAGSCGDRAFLDRALVISPDCLWALILRAHFRYLSGDARGAESDWTRVLRLDVRQPWAWVMRSWARRKNGDEKLARRDMDEAVRLEPGCIIGFEEEVGRRGCLPYHPFGAPTDWIAGQTKMLARALKSDKDNPWMHAALADYRFSNEFALTEILMGLRKHPRSALLLGFLARAYGTLGRRRMPLMRAAMDKALAIDPRMGWLFAWRAEVRKRAGDLRGAERDLSEAVRQDPIYPINFCWRGSSRRQMGDLRGALEDYDRALDLIRELGEDYDFLFTERSIVLRSLGMKMAAVREYCEKATASASFPWALSVRESSDVRELSALERRYPRETRVGAIKAEVLARSGKCRQALRQADRVLAGGRPLALAHWARAESLRGLGRIPKALAAINAAVALRSFSPRFYALRCRLLNSLGKTREAIADLDRIQVIIWRYASFYTYRCRLRRSIGESLRAARELDDLLVVNARYPWANYERFLCLMETRRPLAPALSDLVRAEISENLDCGTRIIYFTISGGQAVAEDFTRLSRVQGKAFALAWRSVMNRALGFPDRATKDMADAVRLDRRCSWVLAWRARDQLEQGRAAEALTDLEAALKAVPRFAWAKASRGKALMSLGRQKEAEGEFNAALALDPGLWECLAERAQLRALNGDWKAALADLDRSIDLDKRNAWVFARRGEILLKKDKNEEALADFDEAIQLHEDYAQAYLWRSQALARLGRLKPALKDAEHAVRLDPAVRRWVGSALAGGRLAAYP